MNKKVNTALFILGATVATTLMALIFIIVPILILGFIMRERFADIAVVATSVIFIAGIIGSFLIYSVVMKKISEKVDMDKYFHPIFFKKKDR